MLKLNNSKDNKIKRVLYITYDGLCDNLGHSQIIPYIFSINKVPNVKLTVISFEKKNKNLQPIKNILDKYKIDWFPLKFTEKKFLLIKILDFTKIIIFPIILYFFNKFKVTHCRGHLPSFSGLILKKIFKVKFIFDCRGLWADERVDNKSWNLKKNLHSKVYLFFKYFEKKFFYYADHTIVLTENLKYFLYFNYKVYKSKITVIPCVADYDKFRLLKPYEINSLKKKLKLNKHDFIIGYFGSISNIYSPEKMINFFLYLKKIYKNPCFIFCSDNFKYLENSTTNYNRLKNNDFLLLSPQKQDLWKYYSLCDYTLSFVISSFARKASFPTKIAESLACGTPIIANRNVGDLNRVLPKLYKNSIVSIENNAELKNLAKKISKLQYSAKKKLRLTSKHNLNLTHANQSYKFIYDEILI